MELLGAFLVNVGGQPPYCKDTSMWGPFVRYANRGGMVEVEWNLTAHLESVRWCQPGPHRPSEKSKGQPTTQ